MNKNKRIIILIISFIVLIGLSALFFKIMHKKKNNKVNKRITSSITTTTKNEKKVDVNIEDVYNKFVLDNKLIENDSNEVYDMESLKNDGCVLAKFASSSEGEYAIGFISFDNVENSSKFFKKEVNYLKTDDDSVKIYSKNIIQDRKKDNYEVFEIIKQTDGINTGKVYQYVYELRMDNYYINIVSTNDRDITLDMTKLKDELEVNLKIKNN